MNINLQTKWIIWSLLLLQPLSAHSYSHCEAMLPKVIEDSVTSKCDTTFLFQQLILPVSLIAVGAFGVCNSNFKKLNSIVKNDMDELRGSRYFHADDYVQYLPIISYLGLDFIGVKSKHCFKERLVVGASSYLCMAIFINSTKHIVKEPRPDSGARNSFPSGHTATAFTGAELMREEYGTMVGLGVYAFATGVAFLRLYNGRHWLNDVIAGAGVGILSARIGYWMLPLYQRWFKWNTPKSKETVVLLPGYSPDSRSWSINFAYTF